jgi:hypothetical protein
MIATHLILLTLLLGLTVTGLKFINSCKSQLFIEWETIQGDASCIMDKNIGIRYETEPNPGIKSLSDLKIQFPDGTPRYSLSSQIEDVTVERLGWSNMDLYIDKDPNSYDLYASVFSPDMQDREGIGQIDTDYLSIPQKYDPNGEYGLDYWVRFYSTNLRGSSIRMDGITYCTIRNDSFDNYRYGFTYSIKPEAESFDPDREYQLGYTVRSGIWAIDETNPDAILQNVVPYWISGPSGPQVIGIYAIEKERAIALLTIENNRDLYVTLYDTKTKTARDPVLIFHSDTGEIDVHVFPNNDTCPMGSIYVLIRDEKDRTQSKAFAVSLQKNGTNDSIESICYPFEYYQSYDGGDLSISSFSTTPNNDDHSKEFGKPELFFFGEEVWMVSFDRFESNYDSYIYLNTERAAYPISLDELSDTEWSVYPYSFRAYREGTLFYEALLSVDSSVAYRDARIDPMNLYTFRLGSDTRIALTVE